MSTDTARAIATLRGMTAKFDNSYRAATPFYPNIATIRNSTGADEKYGFLGALPGVREWLGDRIFNSLRAGEFTIVNKEWEDSIAIEKNDIDDDRIGMYDMAFEMLGAEAAMHPDELMFDLISNGASSACFDGQYFFDTDHSWGDSGTQSNALTHDATDHTAVTEDEFRAAYRKMTAALYGYKRDNGKPFHRPTLGAVTDLMLLVPTGLADLAERALYKPLIGSGESNVIRDVPKVVTIPHFTSGVKIYLLRTGQPMKPFVFQARRPLARQMKGLDDREFKDVKFMTDARYNAGYLAWWNAVQLTFN